MKSPKIKLNSAQGQLFFLIAKKISDNRSLVNELANTLCKEESTIYKKLKGQTRLTLEEAALLFQQYRISKEDILKLFEQKRGKNQFEIISPDLSDVVLNDNHQE